MASFVRAVYLLELDRQENRTQDSALAPNWWIPFRYKLKQTLIDERDGSIFGAIFEWDRSAALSDMLPIRPSGAPKAVLALRGTLLKSPTRRRDIEDDLRFAAWESLKGSVRFNVTLEALKSLSDIYGSRNICIAGHSLGAGFGLQVGKELAQEGINVEAHLFNPPSVSLAMSPGNIGETVEYAWSGLKYMFSSGSQAQVNNDRDKTDRIGLKRLMPRLLNLMDAGFGEENWVPHLYVNSNDYISCFYRYTYTNGTGKITDEENLSPTNGKNPAKLFVGFKENQKFLEAHSLKQWLSSDAELHGNEHITIRSFNIATPSLVILSLYPHVVSSALSYISIRETTDFIWNILKSVPLSSGKAQVSISNHGDSTSGVGLMGWIPQLSGLKDATSYWVWKCVPYLYVYSNYGTGEKIVAKENVVPINGEITATFSFVTREKLNFLSAHGLEQRWPSDAELTKAIHNSIRIRRQLGYLYTSIPWKVTHLLKPSSVSLAMSLTNIREKEEFVWKWNSLKSMLPSSSEAHAGADGDKTSDVGLKSWMLQLYGLKDAGLAVGKSIPHVNSINSDYISKQLRSLYRASASPSQLSHLFNLPSVWPTTSLKNTGEKEDVCNRLKSMSHLNSEAEVSNEETSGAGLRSWIRQLSWLKDAGFGLGKWVPQPYGHKSDGTPEKMFDKENAGPSHVGQEKQS